MPDPPIPDRSRPSRTAGPELHACVVAARPPLGAARHSTRERAPLGLCRPGARPSPPSGRLDRALPTAPGVRVRGCLPERLPGCSWLAGRARAARSGGKVRNLEQALRWEIGSAWHGECRRRHRHPTAPLEHAPETILARHPGPDAAERAESIEAARHLLMAAAAIPARQWRVLLLRKVSGLAPDQVCDALAISRRLLGGSTATGTPAPWTRSLPGSSSCSPGSARPAPVRPAPDLAGHRSERPPALRWRSTSATASPADAPWPPLHGQLLCPPPRPRLPRSQPEWARGARPGGVVERRRWPRRIPDPEFLHREHQSSYSL